MQLFLREVSAKLLPGKHLYRLLRIMALTNRWKKRKIWALKFNRWHNEYRPT